MILRCRRIRSAVADGVSALEEEIRIRVWRVGDYIRNPLTLKAL